MQPIRAFFRFSCYLPTRHGRVVEVTPMLNLYLRKGIAWALALLMLSGCTSPRHWFEDTINTNGANPAPADNYSVRRLDLPRLIAGSALGGAQPDFDRECPSIDDTEAISTQGTPGAVEATGRRCLERATTLFYADTLNPTGRRNQVQARLLAASNAQCSVFLQGLNSLQSNVDFLTGVGATVAGAVGAITGEAGVARSMAGVAAGLTGVRAEFNADIFYKETVAVLAKGIKESRDQYYLTTIVVRRAQSIDDYPLWDAIGDAIRYNDKCSLESGLETASDALALAESPGIDAMNRTLLKMQQTRLIMNGKLTDPNQLITDSSLSPSGIAAATAAGTAGSGLANVTVSVQALTNARTAATKTITALNDALVTLGSRTLGSDDSNALKPLVTGPDATGLLAALNASFLVSGSKCETAATAQATAIAKAVTDLANKPTDPTNQASLQVAQNLANGTAQRITGFGTILGGPLVSATVAVNNAAALQAPTNLKQSLVPTLTSAITGTKTLLKTPADGTCP